MIKFNNFLLENNVFQSFYIEMFLVEKDYNFIEESSFFDVRDCNFFQEVQELVEDTIKTEGAEDILDNGFFFHYQGQHNNTITDIDWSSVREEYKKTFQTTQANEKEIFSLGILRELTSYAYYHDFKGNLEEFFIVGKEFKILNKSYRVTYFDKHRNQVHAFQILKTNKTSETKKVIISEELIDYKTLSKR